MTPGTTKNYTVEITEDKDWGSRSFAIRNMPAYEDTDSTYTVNDWSDLDNTEEKPVDYSHDGTTIGVSSDEEAAAVIERWLAAHGEDVPDPNDQDSWLYDPYYGLPLYLYLFTIALVAVALFAYRRGKKEGKEEGKFYSKVEEQKKMKTVEKDTLQTLGRQPSTGLQPETLSGTKLTGPGSFAPPPSLGATAPTFSPDPQSHPTIGAGTVVPQGQWQCGSCGFAVGGKFSFCTRCGARKNS